MKSRFKKIAALMVALIVLGSLFGCDAHIDVIEQAYDGGRYYAIDFVLDRSLDTALRSGAAVKEGTKKWTLEDWLQTYFDAISSERDFTASYGGKTTINGEVYYSFDLLVPDESESEEVRELFDLHAEASQKTNLFFRKISVTRDDRFNSWIEAYTQAYERGEPEQIGLDRTMVGIVQYGLYDVYPQLKPTDDPDPSFLWDEASGVYYKVACPSFFDAFPVAKRSEYGELVLNNFWYASKKMNVSSDAVVAARNADGTTDSKGVYYLFSKRVRDGDTTVLYDYYRADPFGWYIVAIAGGGLAVLLVWGIAKMRDKKRNKPKKTDVRDLFPYDPFE